MLNHSSLLLEIARVRQQEMFQQAEADRLYQQLKGNQSGVLQRIGHRLLAATLQLPIARQLKVHSQLKPVPPVFSKK